MFSMFSPDSKFMQVLSRCTDLVLLNICFLITSIPVVTIGAATAALYTLCFRMLREEEVGIIKSYFRAFRENFRQGTVLWLLELFVLLPGLYYFDTLFHMEGVLRFAFIPMLGILLAAVFVGSYAFPWISQFRNRTPQVLMNSLILSVSKLPRTLFVAMVNLLPWALLLWESGLFLRVSFLWVALYFAAAAYINAAMLLPVFKPYREGAQ